MTIAGAQGAGGLGWIDWAIVAAYVVFALGVGVRFARRAGKDVDEYFLSGRTLPWWIAGTSMVATTFAIDTPLFVTGLIRDKGIWSNWLWWCFTIGGMLTVFLFARYWRRGEVMTTAELAELRYGGSGAKALRGTLGFLHAGVTNTIVLVWVLGAMRRFLEAFFDVDRVWGVTIACLLALTYSLMAGFWGVVLTDVLQFAMSMIGAILLAVIAVDAAGGMEAITTHIRSRPELSEVLAFVPAPGPGGPLSASFWTESIAAFAVFLGVAWWAKDGVDGGGVVVQRLSATRDERQGVLAALWYQVANAALRPWPWILVALASLVILPEVRVTAPVDGALVEVEAGRALIDPGGGGEPVPVTWSEEGDWHATARVAATAGATVSAGDTIARTDSELAYAVMLKRFLPVGLLGLVAASLLAAFMSTVDTHVNLASSFFINDLYRRFVRPDASAHHYVTAARLTGAVVMGAAGVLAMFEDSIADLFKFFLALLGGVGPVYVLRWFWWRVRASTEIVAMLVSCATATWLTYGHTSWPLGPLAPGGELSHPGRLCLVVLASGASALLSMALTKAPDPRTLVDFYRRVRPMGWWGPVRALAPEVTPPREAGAVAAGVAGGLLLTFGLLFGLGWLLLGEGLLAAFAALAAGIGGWLVARSLGRLSMHSGTPVKSP